MKRILKIVAILIAIVVFIFFAVALYIHVTGIPSYDTPDITFNLQSDSAAIAEGARISAMLCSECHRGSDRRLSGKHVNDIDPVFGTVISANITNHPEYGIGKYTPEELAYLLRTGVKRDGKYAPPYMVKLPLVSDEDMNAIIAFLKSDHPLVQASAVEQAPSKPSFLVKMLSRFAFVPLPYPDKPIPAPDKSNKLEFGRYLVSAKAACYDCHSADFKTNNPMEPEKSIGYFGGGNRMLDLDGNFIYSPNITPDKETGIGSWTLEEFEKAVRWGQHKDGKTLRYPMPVYTVLTEVEIEAMWEYLQTVPTIKNAVERNWEE